MSAAGAVLFVLLAGYVSGSLPFGLWLGRAFRGVDIRRVGSGNLGATNVYRTLGPVLGVATLLLDVLKGALPVWLVPHHPWAQAFPGGAEWCRLAVGFAAVAGHIWTMFSGFRGGKGVATTVGVLMALAPTAFAVFVGVFVLVVAVTRYISLGSILGAVSFVVALAIGPNRPGRATLGVGAALALLIIARHRDNIVRLTRGEEPRFSLRVPRARKDA